MTSANQKTGKAFFMLSRWCNAKTTWLETAVCHGCVGECESAASERGIYRVSVVCEGQRIHLEPFAIIGHDPADDA
jgi:hypothetical protein